MSKLIEVLTTSSVNSLLFEVEKGTSFDKFAFDCPDTEMQYAMQGAQTEL